MKFKKKYKIGKRNEDKYQKLSDIIKVKFPKYKSKISLVNKIRRQIHNYDNVIYIAFLIFLIIVAYITHYHYFPIIPEEWFNHFNKCLISIHVGLGALIIALVIFIANNIKDAADSDIGYIYLQESKIKILLLIQLSGYASIAVNAAIGLQASWAFVSGCFVMYSFSRSIKLHMDKNRFSELLINLYNKKIKNYIHESIAERIATNYLYKINQKQGMALFKYYPHSFVDSKYHYYQLEGKGVIGDINFKILYNIGEVVQKYFKEKIYVSNSYENSTPLPGQIIENPVIVELIKGYNYSINLEDSNIIRISNIDREKLAENVDREISKTINKAFEIADDDNISQSLGKLFQEKQDGFIKAIKNSDIGKIDEFITFYLSVVENFINEIALAGGYDYYSARNEVNNWFMKWPVISWLQDSLQRIFQLISTVDDFTIIKKLFNIPLHFALRGLYKNDHYIFQAFIQYSIYPYLLIKREGQKHFTSNQINYLFDHTSNVLKEIINFHILPQIKTYQLNKKELKRRVPFIWPIYRCYIQLLRESFRTDDQKYFERLINNYNDLLKYLEIRDFEILFSELNHYHNIELTYFEKEMKIVLRERIVNIIGIASWIFKNSNNKNKYIEQIIGILPRNIYYFLYLYIYSRIQDRWGLDYWDNQSDGEVYEFDSSSWIDRFCIYYIIITIEQININDEMINAILNIEKDDVYNIPNIGLLAKETLPNLIDSLMNEKIFVNNSSLNIDDKVNKLKELLKRINELYDEKSKDKIRNAKLSNSKISSFKEEVLKSYIKYSGFISLYRFNNKYNDKSGEPSLLEEGNPTGINQLFAKDVFIDEEPAFVVGMANFGEQLSSYVNTEIIKNLYQRLPAYENKNNKISFDSLLEDYKINNPLFIFTDSTYGEIESIIQHYEGIYHFNYDNSLPFADNPFLNGFIKTSNGMIPVFRVHVNDESLTNMIFIIDFLNIGEFIQLPPTRIKERMSFQYGILQIRITDLNDDSVWRKKLVEKVDFMPEVQDPIEKDIKLKEHVIIEIYHNYKVQWPENIIGCKIKINNSI